MSAVSLILGAFGYEIRKIRQEAGPLVSPWLEPSGEFAAYYARGKMRTLVSADRCYVLYRLASQALQLEGDLWECGVYQGGTAAMLAALLADRMPSKKLYLFDTFEGMPAIDPQRDLHAQGDFADTSAEAVARFVGQPQLAVIRKGLIPASFAGLESARIAFAHVDVDIYRSVLDCLEFIWPRLARGGFIVCDDYGFPSCPGAKAAVDEFFATQPAMPLCLPTGQALIFKSSPQS